MSRRTPKSSTSSSTPRARSPRGASNSRKSHQWWWRLSLLVLLGVTLIVSGNWVLHRSFFLVQDVTLRGVVHESRAQILLRSGLASHPAMIDVNDGVIEHRLEQFRWVATAHVSKQWPHTLVITVVERSPAAVVHDSHGHLVLVDGADHALGVIPSSTNFPLLEISGASPSAPWQFWPWAAAAAQVASQLPVAFSNQVAAVTISRQGVVSLIMTTPLTFVLGLPSDLSAKFTAIASVIHASVVNSVALRAGDVIDVTVPGSLTVTGP